MSDSNNISDSYIFQRDIFDRLLAGETILPNDPQIGRLREEAFAIKALLVRMNNSSNPDEITELLSEILDKKVQDVAIFHACLHQLRKEHSYWQKCLYQFRLYLPRFGWNYY
jgi:hypothetical protein